jgi:hypothetical protein
MMILRDQVPCRLTLPGAFGAGLITLLALPSWSAAARLAEPSGATSDPRIIASSLDDDDDAPRPKKAGPDGRGDRPAPKGDVADKKEGKKRIEIQIDLTDLEKAFGPDSDLVKSLEKLGPEIERQVKENLGPEFEARMKAMGERIGKEMEKKFGPGSEFEAKMKALGERLEKKLGPGSEFESRLKEKLDAKAWKDKPDVKTSKDKLDTKATKDPSTRSPSADRVAPEPRARARRPSQAQRIEELQRRIDELSAELRRLKEADEPEDDGAPRRR